MSGQPLSMSLPLSSAMKMGLLGSLYFAQGLPYGFFTQALPVLMRQQGSSLPEIGLASLLTLPWALKFLWAPVVDGYWSRRIGRRRSWILPLQAGAALVMAGMAGVDPRRGLAPLMVGFLLASFLAATQDIATDALAVDLLSESERGLGNGVQVAGYRVGMICGGGLIVIILGWLGWGRAFLLMAGLLLISTGPIVWFREGALLPGAATAMTKTDDEAGALSRYVKTALAFVRRPGAGSWLLLLFLYKSGEAFAVAMVRAFFVDAGLTLADIGWMLGTVGSAANLLGAMAGGVLTGRLGRRRALLLFSVVQAVSVSGYGVAAALHLARSGPGMSSSLTWLYALCALESLSSGLATAALFTAMMDVSRPETGATDYTLQACVVVVATGLAASASGFSARALGYPGHFGLAALLCLLGVFGVLRLSESWDRLRRP